MTAELRSRFRPIVIRCLIILGVAALVGLLFPQVSLDTNRHRPHAESLSLVQGLLTATNAYATEYGSPVSGSPAQILATLRGGNPHKTMFFDTGPSRINAQGALVDYWRTPIRFDMSNPQKPRIWSCGPNRKDEGGAAGTDDIVSWR